MSYPSILQEAKHKQILSKAERFARISDRVDRSDFSASVWEPLMKNALLQTWKDVILWKGIMEIALYPMLLYELQPKVIIEIGAFNGGSALWLADHLEMFGIEGSVYSVDMDLSLLDGKAKAHPRIHFFEGDANNLGTVISPNFLSALPHPWLVIEDADADIVKVVEYLHHNGLKRGDYLIVEDTNQFVWDYWSAEGSLSEETKIGRHRLRDLRNWLIKHEDEYLVDKYYQDMHGYNGSKSWNSILKRI